MKYIQQFVIILAFTAAGELLHFFLPLPIPAAIYGLLLLFAALCTGIVKLEQVKETAGFLIAGMSVLFVSPAVNILESWDLIRPELLKIVLITVLSTALTFAVSGMLVQRLVRRRK